MQGRIVKNISNDYTVRTTNEVFTCKARGKFKNIGLTPMVGDIVTFNPDTKYIMNIQRRKNQLIRPFVSNVDQAIIVTSVKEPNFSSNLLDKLLTIISFNNITPIICLTKLDLLNKEEQQEINKIVSYYKSIGYQVIENTKKQELTKVLKNKINVFTGQSGSGKSTLINKLDKNLNLKTDTISKSLGRGKHTTRHTELYEINGGYIVDTPGFSSVDFHGMSKLDIRDNMNDMFDNLEYCKYRDCLHLNEDGCYVKKLVADNKILKTRYENYLKFISQLRR
ncbi:MAG: ribosome small subunit-dependent GTPase A [bacterium]|nr:ribosome small subunit-dependent GTPase A [bacterium]